MQNSTQPTPSAADILIVDDHAAVRAGLRNLISSRAGWHICGEAANGEQAVSLALKLKPSVIIMDISMPGVDGLEATRRIREHLPTAEVLIVSQHDSEQVVTEAQKAGARGFVVKSHLSADLLPALEAALLHSSRISAPVSKAWQGAISSTKEAAKQAFIDPGPHDDLDLMSGGGQMGAVMRVHDWSNTAFGPVSAWPQSLRTALRICLDSRFPIVIWWGPELRLLYNDAWLPTLGTTKGPHALGAPGKEVWSDIWDTVGPALESVMQTGQAIWENDQLLLFDRHGYVEETYWTHSYIGIRLASGEVGGVFAAVHEVTDRVLNARRLKTLREMADQLAQSKNEQEACTLAIQSIGLNPADCPYSMIFLCEGTRMTRVAASFDADSQIPATFDESDDQSWALQEAIRTRLPQVFDVKHPESTPPAPFGDRCKRAISIPILDSNRKPIAVMTIGISPYRTLDSSYREFLESLAKNLATNINNARAYELERKLRFDAELLASIVASSDDAIVSKNLDGIITSWNKSAERIFGYTAEEACGQHITLIIPRDRRGEEVHILNRLRRGERVDHFQTVRRRKDGAPVDISVTISPVRDATGKVIGASKVARDITAQLRTQEASRQSEERFRAIVETTPECVTVIAPDGTLLHMNTPGLQMVGATSAEAVIGKSVYNLIAPEHRDKFRAFNEAVCAGHKGSLEFDIIGLEGRRRHMETHAAPLRDPDRTQVHLAITLDITDRKQAEDREREITAQTVAATAKFRAVFEQTTVFAGITTHEGVVIDANRLWLDACGYRADDVLGLPLWQTPWWRNFPASQEAIRTATPLAAQGTPFRQILNYSWADGTERLVDFALYPIVDDDGHVLFLHPTGVDITDLKRAEENYRDLAETLEAEVQARTLELENRNAEVLRQSELLREFSQRLLQTQDEERRHIARELHDSAGQTLTVLGINLAQLIHKAGRSSPELAAAAETIRETVEQLQREIRTTSYLLHPPLLDESGLASALNWYVEGLAERSGLHITLDISEDVGRLPA